ncbi:proline-rich protein 36 isoform X2 [Neocloeon triangulifer]|uniref:proline-rich protein 36 isoform X2 n=1 Tax=Neocloeon triangulifer TaxID=2078957 RepID=UPI00286ED0AC|nr:proline-rich protein 36 isoform X2 [Neocloeon triangulifer]
MIKRWSPRASPLRLSELSPLASEDDGLRSAGCTVVLDQLPSELLESLSSDGHVRMSLPTPPDSVRGDDGAEQDTVSELLRDMVDRLDAPRRRKKKSKSKHRRHHHERPRVSPIFVWVRQAEEGVIGEVWCEDYDKRNRLRLTKTPAGWRAIPRTHTLSELQGAIRRDSADSMTGLSDEDEMSEREDGKVQVAEVQVDQNPELEDNASEHQDDVLDIPDHEEEEDDPELEDVPEEDNEEEEDVPDPEEEEGNALEMEEDVPPTSEEVPTAKEVEEPVENLEGEEKSGCVKKEELEDTDEKPAVVNPELVADLSAKKKEPGPLPCRSPLLRLPPLPRKPLPSPNLQQPPCEYRTPSPAHQAVPLALPGIPRSLQSPLPAHVHERPPKRPLETPEAPAKRLKGEPTLRELLREKKHESRLMELLTTSVSTATPKRPPPVVPSAPMDALAQLRLVMSQLRVPDPLLIPQSRLSALLASPATEIPRLLAVPPSLLAPDVIPVALDRLQALLQRPDSELLAWAAQDWALPGPPAWPPASLTALHLAAMGFCPPPPMDTWHTPPPPAKLQSQLPAQVAAPMKSHPAPAGHQKPRIACKALSDLMPKKNKAPKQSSAPLVSTPSNLTVGLQGATKNLPQLWHPLFGSHTSDSWNWRKTVPVHGD